MSWSTVSNAFFLDRGRPPHWEFSTVQPTASLVIYISSYPARPRRITVNYYVKVSGIPSGNKLINTI